MLNKTSDIVAALRNRFLRIEPEELHYGARISVCVRWFLCITCLILINYRVDFGSTGYILYNLYTLTPMVINGYAHYRLRGNRSLTPGWLLALHGMDVVVIAIGLAISGGFQSNFVTLYYPVLALFAATFTSAWLTFSWVTIVAAIYVALCLTVGSGLDFAAQEEEVVISRLATLYAVVMAVHLVVKFDRARRRVAVARERELLQERIELSQDIHDTVAQSAYLIGLGLETAIELAEPSNTEQLTGLQATHALSKSTMWELRHPIDGGLIFQGQGLSAALKHHASTFTTITAMPAKVNQHGREPPLLQGTRSLLFSIAHNAMTNALRHARASRVDITLDFRGDGLIMSVADDGVGLAEDYAQRGHGFRNMAAKAARVGGQLTVEPGGSGGTTVKCLMPYRQGQGDGEIGCNPTNQSPSGG